MSVVNQAIDFRVQATDPEGMQMSFSATGLPQGLSMSSGGRIRGTPTRTGTWGDVVITVRDADGAYDQVRFSWQVDAAPRPAPRNCELEGSVASQSSLMSISFTIVNETDYAYELFWINSNARRVSYGSIAPGQQFQRSSYAGHPWLIADDDTSTCRLLLADPRNGDVYAIR